MLFDLAKGRVKAATSAYWWTAPNRNKIVNQMMLMDREFMDRHSMDRGFLDRMQRPSLRWHVFLLHPKKGTQR
jgi:hypothetical protein